MFLAVSRAFRGIMGCSRGVPELFWGVPGCSGGVPGVFQGVPGCSGVFWGCSGFYRHPLFKKLPCEITSFWSRKKVCCFKQGSKTNGFFLNRVSINAPGAGPEGCRRHNFFVTSAFLSLLNEAYLVDIKIKSSIICFKFCVISWILSRCTTTAVRQ